MNLCKRPIRSFPLLGSLSGVPYDLQNEALSKADKTFCHSAGSYLRRRCDPPRLMTTPPLAFSLPTLARISLSVFPLSLHLRGEGHGNPLQYSCLENPIGQKRLVSLSPWGCKVPDTTEWLTLHLHSSCSSFKILITPPTLKEVIPLTLDSIPHPLLHELAALPGSQSSTLSLHLLSHLANPAISDLSPILSLSPFLLTNLEELL